jgi:uncharacterized protein (DUF1499 family)
MNLPGYKRRTLMLSCVLPVSGCSSAPGKPACGALPNCVNTRSASGLQASEPLRANPQQWQILRSWITRQDGWNILIGAGHFIQVVVKTPVMGFRDELQLLYLHDVQLIQVRSSSRLGLSDLGTNARRVEALRTQLVP